MTTVRRGVTITALLIVIATVPAFAMFLVVSGSLYASRVHEVRRDLDDRGHLLAAALAESSRYGVVSGNVPALELSLQRLLATDASIAGIQILDPQRHLLASAGTTASGATLTFEHPIRMQAIDVDLFEGSGSPQGIGNPRPRVREGALAGYTRVYMSPEPLMRAKRNGLLMAGAMVLVAAMLSALLGVALSQLVRRPLSSVMRAVRAIQRGDFSVQFPHRRHGELGELQGAMVEMARELAASRHELEAQVAQRTAQLQEAVNALRSADDEKRRLIAHGNMLVEEERRRIAAEIHDQLNASLLAVRLLASSLKSRAGQPLPPDEVNETAMRIESTADEVYQSARRIVTQLRPEVLDMLGLRAALAGMVREYDQVHPSCRFEFRCPVDFPRVPPQLSITVYRIAQEALSNVVKHAQASWVVVSLDVDEAKGELKVSVSDNGRGIADSETRRGFGVIGMRERASGAGGTLEIAARPGGGTVVEARFALNADSENARPTAT
ncbi:MAG TPA: histidine kinase [Burkholderiaceae bacterium]|nr:histidine kinase [Burkholderiaceae bacterium]